VVRTTIAAVTQQLTLRARRWAGDRLFDWAMGLSDARVYGENAHHDVTWLATNSGTVSQSLRYDPFGNPRATPPVGYTPFRFQGSWYDSNTDLSWVVTRWHAEAQRRFLTEDTLLGEPADPASRQLYAYAEGTRCWPGTRMDGSRCPTIRQVTRSVQSSRTSWRLSSFRAVGQLLAVTWSVWTAIGPST